MSYIVPIGPYHPALEEPVHARLQVEGEEMTLLQLMESMFELGFLDVSDMRWRTPTKTLRKKGE